MGHVYDDGPAPLGLRFQINSASLDFKKKEWQQIPEVTSKTIYHEDKKRKTTKVYHEEYQEILVDEKLLGLGRYENRSKKLLDPSRSKKRRNLSSSTSRGRRIKTTARTTAGVAFDIKGEVKAPQTKE